MSVVEKSFVSKFQWPNVGKDTRVFDMKLTYKKGLRGLENISAECEIVPDKNSEATGSRITVAELKGHIIMRPSKIFHELADEVSGELRELACMFCDNTGKAIRVEHPKLSDKNAKSGGGFFHIDRVEVNPDFRGQDLGLRFIHEILVLLKSEFTLCVIKPYSMTHTRWSKNECNDKDMYNQINERIQCQFARLGFLQAGQTGDQMKGWFLTKKMYFGAKSKKRNMPLSVPNEEAEIDTSSYDAIIGRWKTKKQVRKMNIHKPKPTEVLQLTTIDQQLRNLVGKFNPGGFYLTPSQQEVEKAAIISKIEDLVQNRGASIDRATALHIAATKNLGPNNYLLKTLVRLGADINARDEDGSTPLHVASAFQNDYNKQYLISSGANESAVNRFRETPAMSEKDVESKHKDFLAAMGI